MTQRLTSIPTLAETIFEAGKQLRPRTGEPKEVQRLLVTKHPEIFSEYASSLVEEAIEVVSRLYSGEELEFEELDNVRSRLMTAQRMLSHMERDDGLNAAINLIGNIALQEARQGVFSVTYFHELALDSFQFIRKYLKPEGPLYGMNLLNEGTALMLMAMQKAERLDDHLEKAIDCFIESRKFFSSESAEYLTSLRQEGNSLIHLYELNPQEPMLLRQAESVFKEALGIVIKDSLEQAELLVHLATIPTYEFVLQGNLDVNELRMGLNRSSYYCLEADKIYEEILPHSVPRGMCLMNLGLTLQLLAKIGTDILENFQGALSYLITAREHLQQNTIEYCRCLNNEAMARTEIATHEKISLVANLMTALELLHESQKILYEIDRHSIDYAIALYAEALARFTLGVNKHGARENLQRSIELCERVFEMIGFGTFLFIRTILIQSMARLSLAEILNRTEDLESVYLMLERAEELIMPGSPDYAECMLAKAQLLRIANRPLDEFLEAIGLAKEHYLMSGNELLGLTVEIQSALAELQAGEFKAAQRRSLAALETQAHLLDANDSMPGKKFLLEQSTIIRSTLVESFLAENNPEDAVFYLEHGRNLLLSKYFESFVGEIEELNIDAMKDLAKRTGRTIVNISVCTAEVTMFLFRPDRTLRLKKLPIRQQDLSDQIFARDLAGTPLGWFSTYYDYLADKELNRDYLPSWRNQISSTIEWLIAYFVRPLYEEIGEDGDRLAFVGGSQFSMLPLHAAIWTYMLDENAEAELPDIIFAPSMWLLMQSVTNTEEEDADENSVAIFRWEDNDLRWAELEIGQIQNTLMNAGQPTVMFSGDEQRFVDALQLADSHSIWHFVCHGSWEWDDILRSSLFLTPGNWLSLAHLFESYEHRFARVRLGKDDSYSDFRDFPRENYNPKLVVFSACEIGIGTEAFADTESCFSFSTAFLLSGTSCIIAALWAVDDFTTSILMGRFYKNLGYIKSYSAALREAQIWLRNLRLEELQEILEEQNYLHNFPGILKRLQKWQRKNVSHPFAEPYYWAAFQVTGNTR